MLGYCNTCLSLLILKVLKYTEETDLKHCVKLICQISCDLSYFKLQKQVISPQFIA